MRLLLDENGDARLGPFLVRLGHDVNIVARDYPAAITDSEILQYAVAESRVLLTRDLDFGELIYRDERQHAGVMLLRLRSRSLDVLQERMARVLEQFPVQHTDFVVITEQSVRPRR